MSLRVGNVFRWQETHWPSSQGLLFWTFSYLFVRPPSYADWTSHSMTYTAKTTVAGATLYQTMTQRRRPNLRLVRRIRSSSSVSISSLGFRRTISSKNTPSLRSTSASTRPKHPKQPTHSHLEPNHPGELPEHRTHRHCHFSDERSFFLVLTMYTLEPAALDIHPSPMRLKRPTRGPWDGSSVDIDTRIKIDCFRYSRIQMDRSRAFVRFSRPPLVVLLVVWVTLVARFASSPRPLSL